MQYIHTLRRYVIVPVLLHAILGMAPVAHAQQCNPGQRLCNGVCMTASLPCCDPDTQKECNNACIPKDSLCCPPGEINCNGRCVPDRCVCLLEPLPVSTGSYGPDVVCQDVSGGFAGTLFFQYLNTGGLWRWALGIGAGLAVINVTFGGFQIALSNGDQGRIGEGKERIMWSILGLMMLMFAGVLLNFINPLAFTQRP